MKNKQADKQTKVQLPAGEQEHETAKALARKVMEEFGLEGIKEVVSDLAGTAVEGIEDVGKLGERIRAVQMELFPALSSVNDAIERVRKYEGYLAFAIYFVSVSHLALRDLLLSEGLISLEDLKAGMVESPHRDMIIDFLELRGVSAAGEGVELKGKQWPKLPEDEGGMLH